MWFKQWVYRVLRGIGAGLVRWLEMLGQNPTLVRDHGIAAWQQLHEQLREERPSSSSSGVRLAGRLGEVPFSRREITPLRMTSAERQRRESRPSA